MESNLPVLVAEDNEDDIFILQAALKNAGIHNPVHICRDGQEVIHYLKAEGPYSDRGRFPFPRLLIIDLKMPILTGFDVLRWLRGHPECSVVPIVVLTSSRHEQDITNAYKLGANAYLVKPGRIDDFRKVLMLLKEFWTICELPPVPHKC